MWSVFALLAHLEGYCAVSVLTGNARECTQLQGEERKGRMMVDRLLRNKGHITFFIWRGEGGTVNFRLRTLKKLHPLLDPSQIKLSP